MKKLLAALLLFVVGSVSAQELGRLGGGASLPKTCTSSLRLVDAFILTSGVTGTYRCVAPGNAWTLNGSLGSVVSVGNGTIGAPFLASWATATTTPALSLSFASQSGRKFFASPSDGSTGAVTARAIVAADVPTLNQDTTGTAAKLKVTSVLVSALPACNAGAEGSYSGVTDALAPAFAVSVTGGGSVHVGVYCDGTNWITQ